METAKKDRFETRAFDAFNEMFETRLPDYGHNHRNTFEAVNEAMNSKAGYYPFRSYESFKNAKSRNRKKNRGN